VLVTLLVYTATYMPYKTCFIDDPSEESEQLDVVVDWLFMFDIFVNFLSAIEKSDGRLINNPKIIASEYLRSWFAFDFLSVLPFDKIQNLIPNKH
jgi:potassium channel